MVTLAKKVSCPSSAGHQLSHFGGMRYARIPEVHI